MQDEGVPTMLRRLRMWGVGVVALTVLSLSFLAAAPRVEGLQSSEGHPATQLEFVPATVDFGRVDPYTANTRAVQIRNNSPRPIALKGVQSSCSCTLAALRQYTVPAGGSVPLDIRLDLQHYNSDTVHTRIVAVPAESGLEATSLEVSADIVPEFTVSPAELDLGKIKYGTETAGEFRVRKVGGPPARVVGVEAPSEWDVAFKSIGPDAYAIKVAVKPDAPQGLHAGRIAVLTDLVRRPRLELPVRCETVGIECTVTPRVVVFGPVPPGNPAGSVEVRNSNPIELVEVQCPPRTFVARVEPLDDSRRVLVHLVLAAEAPPGNLAGKISLVLQEGKLTQTREVSFFGTVQAVPGRH
jgi:hypothetical protein